LPKTAYFLGDSHTVALQALASRLIAEKDVARITIIAKPGCLFSISIRTGEKSSSKECLGLNHVFLSKILETGNEGDIVILTNRYKLYFLEPNYDRGDADRPYSFLFLEDSQLSKKQALAKYSEELISISQKFAKKGISLVVQAPLPDWKHQLLECQPEWFHPAFLRPETCHLNAEIESQTHSVVLNSFLHAETKSSYLHIYDPFPIFCNSKRCNPFLSDGTPLFSDADHLNNYGAEYMYDDFKNFLKARSLL
jgi:hypothetical protein